MSWSLERGQVVGERFKLDKKLGSGSFGDVWLANDRLQGGNVAVKLLKPQWAANPRVMQRFETEIQVLSMLDHPSIARSIAASIALPNPYLVLEFVVGETLFDRLAALAAIGRSLGPEETTAILSAVALGIDHAHLHGVLHRDLKPSNIMLPAEPTGPRARILDFGIAKILEVPRDQQTTVGRVIGTDNYLAPEQLRGGDIGPTADVFSLGCVAFSLLTTRYAFAHDVFGQPRLFGTRRPTAETPMDVAHRIANEPRPNASAFRAELGPEVDYTLRKAMAVAPEERYPAAMAFVNALREALSRPVSARTPSVTGGLDPAETQDASGPVIGGVNPPAGAIAPLSASLSPREPAPLMTRVMPGELDPPRLESSTNPGPTPSAPLVIGVLDPTGPPVLTRVPSESRWPLAAGATLVALVLALAALALTTGAPTTLPQLSPEPPGLEQPTIGAHPLQQARESTVAATQVPTPPAPKHAAPAPSSRTSIDRTSRRSPPADALESALGAARNDPSNLALLERLARTIDEAASQGSTEDAAAVKRCLASARFDLELAALERCAERVHHP